MSHKAGTSPTVTFAKGAFTGAPALDVLHRGLNVATIGDGLQWDASVPADSDFYDVAADVGFRGLMNQLDLGSVRLVGGVLANYYDVRTNDAWVDWALNSSDQYNADMDWPTWWSFHGAIGSPILMTTANPYKCGNPTWSSPNWLPPGAGQAWVNDYAARGITGAYWEAGNETYIQATVPGMTYVPSSFDPDSYPARSCDLANHIHGADASARVGLVVYEHGATLNPLAADLFGEVARYCSLSTFDFLIAHSYAPLHPHQPGGAGTAPRFYQTGVEMGLAYQDLTRSVADLHGLAATYSALAEAPIYVTEYGLLFDLQSFDLDGDGSGDHWLSNWYDKGVALLLMHHYLDLIVQGADGLWFWEAVSKWFRVVDPDTIAPTGVHAILAKLHEQRGRLVSAPVVGSPTFAVTGPVGTGCVEGEPESECWHVALHAGEVADSVPYLRAFGAYREVSGTSRLWIDLLNFDTSSQFVNVSLDGFGLSGSLTFERWVMSSADWDDPISGPSVSTVTKLLTVSGSQATIPMVLVPPRSGVVLSIPLPPS